MISKSLPLWSLTDRLSNSLIVVSNETKDRHKFTLKVQQISKILHAHLYYCTDTLTNQTMKSTHTVHDTGREDKFLLSCGVPNQYQEGWWREWKGGERGRNEKRGQSVRDYKVTETKLNSNFTCYCRGSNCIHERQVQFFHSVHDITMFWMWSISNFYSSAMWKMLSVQFWNSMCFYLLGL